jgi:hypothetical protein
MSRNYAQPSLEHRYQIESLVKAGVKQNSIAKQLQISLITICLALKKMGTKRCPITEQIIQGIE